MIHTFKRFGLIKKAKVDVFSVILLLFDYATDVGKLISGFFAFSKYSLNICKFLVHVLLKSGLETFEHYFASIVRRVQLCGSLSNFVMPLFGIEIKTDLFQSCGHC